MDTLIYQDNIYRTADPEISLIARLFPSIIVYVKSLYAMAKIGLIAKTSKFDDKQMHDSSLYVLRALEGVGVKIEITGVENLKSFDGPCVIVSNHMSTLETLVLAAIIVPFKRMTFVIKEEIARYPLFKYAMVAAKTITVGRKNPREDFKAVMESGSERLKMGISIVVFPQTTRYVDFDPQKFNTIGVKLAKKANVPVVPLALKTDAWTIGRYFKDLGKIDISKKVYFSFGEPLIIRGNGAEEHQTILNFIKQKLTLWEK
ncbi:MAG: 1-acyl-sn-glycerol-3-phosphate acyltransferase [Thermodesulfovibrionales bacterium]|nr:1-acyl-sn-glycerol-3-phosphate acyltransferase [Thermodesulfovibrionales bacterium]